MIQWTRTLRTPSSERFLAKEDGKELAAVDLHYLQTGDAAGTVILLDGHPWDESTVAGLLGQLDEQFLPEVDLARGTLVYTVVRGRVEGVYEPAP